MSAEVRQGDAAASGRSMVLAGIASIIVGDMIFAVMEGLVKWLSAGYPTMQIAFCRSLGALVVTLILAASGQGLGSLRTRRLGGQLWRAVIGFASLYGFFYAYGAMPLADAIVIGFAAPIFMTAFSIPMLGERVGLHRWAAVVVGFVGVVVMVRPGQGGFSGAAMIALGATVLYALAMIQVRKLSRTEAPGTIVFYFSLFSTVASGLAMPALWVPPGLVDGLLLAGVYAELGDRTRAFDVLEQAYARRDNTLLSIATSPVLASLRGDPRYLQLLLRLHYTPQIMQQMEFNSSSNSGR